MSGGTLSSAIGDYIASKREAKPDKWATHAHWLDDAAKRARQISLVTHAPKFTHGDAKGSGERVNAGTSEYLTTSSLNRPALDVIGNAAALDVANLLLIEAEGVTLAEALRQKDTRALEPFAIEKNQLALWLAGLSGALDSASPATHSLSRQVYFPIDDNAYHLLSPIFASALSHALHGRIEASRYSEEAKAARKARRENTWHDAEIAQFTNLAEQHFGGTKPQNVSLLNSKRRGKTWLLSCQPPAWNFQPERFASEAVFWARFSWFSRRQVRELKRFLLSVRDKSSNQMMRQRREAGVSEITGLLYAFAMSVRALPAGWSEGLDYSNSFRHWIDPAFADLPADSQWHEEVGKAFGRWLNRQLSHELMVMGDEELTVFKKQITRELRLLKRDLEVLE